MKKPRTRRAHGSFLSAWLRSPLSMGAIVPSSGKLARAMAGQIDIKHAGVVIELGAGTGPVTDALVEAGVPAKRLWVIEREAALCAILSAQFPQLTIWCEDATHLKRLWQEQGEPRIAAIVSSLPMMSLPKRTKETIQSQMAELLDEGGVIVQFTYGAKSPLDKTRLRQHGITGKRVKTILTNVPPAHVWVYRK
ncbi:MAG: methyltransferase [Alphaproteobacteria bacterium]|nr:methyltransferase [Alphaproteobacteria bacterium]